MTKPVRALQSPWAGGGLLGAAEELQSTDADCAHLVNEGPCPPQVRVDSPPEGSPCPGQQGWFRPSLVRL